MRKFLAISCAIGIATVAGAVSAQDIPSVRLPLGSWQRAADRLQAVTMARGGGWLFTLTCKDGSVLEGTLMNNNPQFPHRITDVKAKTTETQTAVSLHPEQDNALPGLTRLKGIDSLERSILKNQRLLVRVSVVDMDDAIIDFPFPGLSLDAQEVLRRCPPF
jgi:hypothetical protein